VYIERRTRTKEGRNRFRFWNTSSAVPLRKKDNILNQRRAAEKNRKKEDTQKKSSNAAGQQRSNTQLQRPNEPAGEKAEILSTGNGEKKKSVRWHGPGDQSEKTKKERRAERHQKQQRAETSKHRKG